MSGGTCALMSGGAPASSSSSVLTFLSHSAPQHLMVVHVERCMTSIRELTPPMMAPDRRVTSVALHDGIYILHHIIIPNALQKRGIHVFLLCSLCLLLIVLQIGQIFFSRALSFAFFSLAFSGFALRLALACARSLSPFFIRFCLFHSRCHSGCSLRCMRVRSK